MSSSDEARSAEEARRAHAIQVLAQVLADRGLSAAIPPTPALLAELGLSEKDFERLFGDGEGALLAAFELAFERAHRRIAPVCSAAPRWLDGVRAGIAVLLRFLEEEPALGRLLVLSGLGTGERMAWRRLELLEVAVEAIDAGHRERRAGLPRQPRVIAEGVVGALSAVLQSALLSGRSDAPIELYGSLVSIAVNPYLGAAVARRELDRPPPMVEESPHAESGRGGPNAWHLTEAGRAALLPSADAEPEE